MAKVTKNIGKLPVHKGAWVSGTAYAKLNQVTDEGSCLQSKIDNNTAKPITITGSTFTVNAKWQMIADGTTPKLQGDYAKSEGDKVAGDIADLKTGKLDKPTNAGGVDMVLTKTATGSEWQPSKGGGGSGSGFYGLGFKSGDNSVNLTTPKINLGLNDFTVEIWARTEGCNSAANSLSSPSKVAYSKSSIKVYGNTTSLNSIDWVLMEGSTTNGVKIVKVDNTTNQHDIIITRQGTLVTVIVNGRLIKTVTQDRVLDFSEFVFDIANTTYFSLGRVFNYAMSNEEAISMLWNGGRVDEVVLDSATRKRCLLELLPQNIHSKGIYNTGTLGSSHDAVLSKPDQTIFHRERPYKDKQMITGAPSFHPIAMGQECTDQLSGAIYKASVPPVGEEWAVKHWKQINNS